MVLTSVFFSADPVFDGYFVVSHAETVVPDCNVFFTNPSTDNFPQSSVPQFQQQLTFIQEFVFFFIF